MKKVLAFLLAMIMLVALVGCAKEAPAKETTAKKSAQATEPAETAETPETAEKKNVKVTYIAPSTESQYWGEYMLVGVENAAADIEEKYGVTVELTVAGPAAEAETDAYVEAFENVIAKHPDIILTGTLIPDATASLVEEAKEQGIIVNFMSLGLLDGHEDSFGSLYYCDMGQQGVASAKAMLEAFERKGIEPKGKVGIHMSVVVPALEPRMSEFVKYMAENAPEIECLETLYNENDVNNAQANVENQISTYGDELIGVFGANNISGDGIALAVEGAGIQDRISAVAIDSDDLEVEALGKGVLDAIVVQTPYQQAYTAMMTAYEYITTGKQDEKLVSIDAYTVTKENMEQEEYKALLDPTLNKRK